MYTLSIKKSQKVSETCLNVLYYIEYVGLFGRFFKKSSFEPRWRPLSFFSRITHPSARLQRRWMLAFQQLCCLFVCLFFFLCVCAFCLILFGRVLFWMFWFSGFSTVLLLCRFWFDLFHCFLCATVSCLKDIYYRSSLKDINSIHPTFLTSQEHFKIGTLAKHQATSVQEAGHGSSGK